MPGLIVNFSLSFTLKEYQGSSKTFEYIQIWIQDGNGNDLYMAKEWSSQSFSAFQQRSYSTTSFLDPNYGRLPGNYRAVVRGLIPNDPTGPFNFGTIENGVNPKGFTATAPAGRVDVSSGVAVAPSTVTVGQNFTVSFSLKEYQGGTKSFSYI